MTVGRGQLEVELVGLNSQLAASADAIGTLRDSISSVDAEIEVLRGRRVELDGLLKEQENRHSMIASRIEDVNKLIAASVSIEEFHKSLMEVVHECLESKSLSELSAIDSQLSSYKPVAQQQSMPVEPKKEVKGDSSRGKVIKIPLSDWSWAGSLIKTKIRSIKAGVVSLEVGDKVYNLDEDVLFPLDMVTGVRDNSSLDLTRYVYTFALIQWLKENGKLEDDSAVNVLDYLLGYMYDETGGVITPIGNVSKTWYGVVDPSGELIKELKRTSPCANMFRVYTDKLGYSIVVGKIQCINCKELIDKVFISYTGNSMRMKKTSDIDFCDIFSEAFLKVEVKK